MTEESVITVPLIQMARRSKRVAKSFTSITWLRSEYRRALRVGEGDVAAASDPRESTEVVIKLVLVHVLSSARFLEQIGDVHDLYLHVVLERIGEGHHVRFGWAVTAAEPEGRCTIVRRRRSQCRVARGRDIPVRVVPLPLVCDVLRAVAAGPVIIIQLR